MPQPSREQELRIYQELMIDADRFYKRRSQTRVYNNDTDEWEQMDTVDVLNEVVLYE